MRRHKKLLFTACGVISMLSHASDVLAQTSAQNNANGEISDDRPVKGGGKGGKGGISASENAPGSSQVLAEQGGKGGKGGGKGGGKDGFNASDSSPEVLAEQGGKGGGGGGKGGGKGGKGGGAPDTRPLKEGQAASSVSCEWVSPPKIMTTNCEGVQKKTCIGEVTCTDSAKVPFRGEASCTLGKSDAGVASCSDATVCAESATGVGTSSCNIEYATPDTESNSGSGTKPPGKSKEGKR